MNWYTRHDGTTHLVTLLTQAKLVRVNRTTDDIEAWLAESWSVADGRRYTLRLRPNLTFADGHPFTADDVVFSLAAAYDPGSSLGDTLLVRGQKLTAKAIDTTTVEITFPAPFGPGLRLLDNLPILPKHRLQNALDAGAFGRAWGVTADVSELTGLGPFVLTEHVRGQRLVFTRNDRYFRRGPDGSQLPLLQRIIVQIVPDQDAQILTLLSGESDMPAYEVRPEDYAPLRRASEQGAVQLLDLGPGLELDAFWINLNPGAFAGDPREKWIQREELRHAISRAVDRQAFADTVYLGAAVPASGPVAPGNKEWYSEAVPQPTHDVPRAKALLAAIGLQDRNGDGQLEDPSGTPVRFTLLTQKGQTALERGAANLREQLKSIGLTIDVVPFDGNKLVEQFLLEKKYDAVYFHMSATDTDPASNADFWFSSGSSHVWNLEQKTPATPWEREIDAAMTRHMISLDRAERQRAFAEVQQLFAEHAPMLYFAAPLIFVAASRGVRNLTPALSRPQLLWAADSLAVSN